MVNTVSQPTDLEPECGSLPPTDLISDDGKPLETNQHRIAMNVLIRSYQHYRGADTDFYTGGNMFIYYSSAQAENRGFRGPDFFVALNVEGTHRRLSWVVWDEDGHYPDMIVELMSPSTAKVDVGEKKEIYDRIFKTQDYFVYNPFDSTSLKGWYHQRGYQEIAPDHRGWLWCETLGLWLGTWSGNIERETMNWLRFFDRDGNLVLLPEEAASQRAEAEAQRANTESQRVEKLADRLRLLGEDPDLL